MATFYRLDPSDFVISADAISSTCWTTGNPTLTTFFTSSTQFNGSSGNYYVNVFQTASVLSSSAVQFAIAYGNEVGSGSANYNNLVNSNPKTNVKTAWLTLPKKIYSINFLELQNNIKENESIFLIGGYDVSEMDMEFGMKTGYAFTSERCFLIQCINKGLVNESIINGVLMNNRKEQNWGILN